MATEKIPVTLVLQHNKLRFSTRIWCMSLNVARKCHLSETRSKEVIGIINYMPWKHIFPYNKFMAHSAVWGHSPIQRQNKNSKLLHN